MSAVTARVARPLQGSDRVAALLMTMGRPVAARLMKHFQPEEIKAITRAIAEMRPVSTAQVELAIEEFATQFVAGANVVGSPSDVERLLDGVLPPEQISAIMTDILGSTNHSIWDRISGVSEGTIAAYVIKEHPQIAALILSRVKPSCAAKVLGHLPEAMRNAVMRRMLGFKPIVDETMRIIENTIHEDFMVNLARNAGADTHARIADIINKMERDDMENVLSSLATTRPKSAEILKGLLFTFDDIINLPPRARTALFDQVPNDRTVMALKGTDAQFREVILQSLGSRVRRMVEQELMSSEPASHRDVHEARRAITDMALEMAGRGEIELNAGGEDEAYVR
ncbi:flagellar motor switch protein FliG [Ancylobacter sp. IITR112]|uniref:flagellar motor switch protein FliG n=1 Tax=Ancylobacter sp. IITR112 TaxID=3138073 RepID=UPI00352AB63E